ncbi:ATP-binding protein [Streptomyces luteolifulvus]|uniref:ATP-binding protein n=2 Tax=Streptomyces luteolifulvus TaxID=2615112 RepID=A0A6H9UND3_9ACTN|nr:ATP-binding protein [Streptomyces luteolifulvus]
MIMTDIPEQPLLHSFRVFPEDPAAVPKARRLLLSVVRGWNLPLTDETQDDLELLSSEVIANAVLHTTGPCSVTVRWTGVRLRVGVTDTAPGLPAPRSRELYAESGRGLLLVASVAASWGSARTATGKVVWFEVAPAVATAGLDRLAS